MFDAWRIRYQEVHETEPPPPVLLDFVYCHEDREIAEEHTKNHLGKFYNAMVAHYEFDGKRTSASTISTRRIKPARTCCARSVARGAQLPSKEVARPMARGLTCAADGLPQRRVLAHERTVRVHVGIE